MLNLLRLLAKNDDGATAIEYALLASLIAVALIATLQAFGAAIQGIFTRAAAILAGV